MKKADKPVKGMPNKSIVALRKIIGKTQSQFAAMIGVSADTVKSWELGRNRLKPASGQRIRMATGADIASLLRGDGVVLASLGNTYSRGEFDYWRKNFGISNEAQAKEWSEAVMESVRLLYSAAAMPDSRNKDRLPALHMSMLEWLQQAYDDFQLKPQISQILKKRKRKTKHTMSYGNWRADWAEGYREMYNFKDNKTKSDADMLTLETEVWPGWSPGGDMTGAKRESDDTIL